MDVLWGKSNAAGRPNLLLQHLLDTTAVAELLWDNFLARSVRERLDACCDGAGRGLFRLMCGLHDVGKASPAFQIKAARTVPALVEAVRAAGLPVPETVDKSRWHHTLAGGVIVKRALSDAGWSPAAVAWCWPLIAGHHGLVPGEDLLRLKGLGQRREHGIEQDWWPTQSALVGAVADRLEIDLTKAAPATRPSRATQLALSGAIIMADWIASSDSFDGVPDWADVSMSSARDRARRAWGALNLRAGWTQWPDHLSGDVVAARFGRTARPSQVDALRLAGRMPGPGLVVIEAPMGEGKTETALAVAEMLARRFGADGVFVAMPTQATSDPMFTRVLRWSAAIDPEVPVGLLHGKRAFNRQWRELIADVPDRYSDIVDYDMDDDPYGMASADPCGSGQAPAEWLRGSKRGLLMPIGVGTVDHLLYAGTRTKHVMLRHLGLAGKVVILDEVHAYDVYMTQFLLEALRWLGAANVPVIALSATLPPAMRRELTDAYHGRAVPEPEPDAGYPVTTASSSGPDQVWIAQRSSAPARSTVDFGVEILDEESDGETAPLVALLADRLSDGGCALVIRNTVRRAQTAFTALREQFGDDAKLLHGRMTVGDRADRAEEVLRLVGPPDAEGALPRPARLVLVATQVAEQSFDADFDILVSDLAPTDLLLQRAGRVHRHQRGARPAKVSLPWVVVTGLRRRTAGPPTFPAGSRAVYGSYLLLRAAAQVADAVDGGRWTVPDDVPQLVRRCYDQTDVVPDDWADALATARSEWDETQALRRARAEEHLLAKAGDAAVTLAGLHQRASGQPRDEDQAFAVVRDGAKTVEVVLVVEDGPIFRTLAGTALGPNGAAVSHLDVADEVARCAVRLPPGLTMAAKDLRPLSGWSGHSWLARSRALRLSPALQATLGDRRLTYDPTRGLIDEPAP